MFCPEHLSVLGTKNSLNAELGVIFEKEERCYICALLANDGDGAGLLTRDLGHILVELLGRQTAAAAAVVAVDGPDTDVGGACRSKQHRMVVPDHDHDSAYGLHGRELRQRQGATSKAGSYFKSRKLRQRQGSESRSSMVVLDHDHNSS